MQARLPSWSVGRPSPRLTSTSKHANHHIRWPPRVTVDGGGRMYHRQIGTDTIDALSPRSPTDYSRLFFGPVRSPPHPARSSETWSR
jgi:hypothetical protein